MRPDVKDCIIVGGGPAGLTAALYLARFLRDVTVFDAQDGRVQMIPKTHNLTPFPDGISGSELKARMHASAEQYGAVVQHATVNNVEKSGKVFRVTTDRQVETARTVIFATGVFNHRPPLSTEDHDRGLAQGLIRYCPVCDAYEIRDKRVAVLGAGEHGVKEARFLLDYSPTVTLITAGRAPDAEKDGIDVLEAPIKTLALSDAQVVLTFATGEVRRFDTIYVALGTTARTNVMEKLGVRFHKGGCVLVDPKQRTNIEGVYAIGDVTEGLDQIAFGMGQGAVAATEIHNTLPRPGLG